MLVKTLSKGRPLYEKKERKYFSTLPQENPNEVMAIKLPLYHLTSEWHTCN